MSIGILFWLIIILGIIFGFLDYRGDPGRGWGSLTSIVLLVLLCLLGYHAWGFPFHG